jgi:iron complex outermembrane recepter protein
MKSNHPARAMLRATPVAAAVAALLSTSAFAQTAPAAEPQTITVTGIRRGIESAISVKKNSDSIVEAISAEDIGKLPDSSIAESIARLPGLTAQRVAGRASQINIRGLSGDFSTALLNGREQASPGDNRGVEFDQYPSELLSGVLVYKTPDGTLIGQGLSGTIDMQTVRPLSFGGRTISVNLRGQKEGVGTQFTGTGTRFNISYIDQFADRTIGVALGFARLKSSITVARNETYSSGDKIRYDGTTVYQDDPKNPGQVVTFNNGFKYFNDSSEQTRDGAAATIEFKPNKDFSSVLDIFYSKFDKDVIRRGLEIQVGDSWKIGNANVGYQAPTLSNAVITGGKLISGTWGNVDPLSRHIWEPVRDEIQSAGWNNKLKFSPSWTGIADISTSSAKRLERITEIEAGVYDFAKSRPLPGTVTVANFNEVTALQYNHGDTAIVRLTDPESWGQNGYDKVFTTKDTINALRLTAQADLEGLFSRVEFGFNGTDRKKTKSSVEQFLRLPGGTSSAGALPAGTGSVGVGNGFSTISFNPQDAFPGSYNLVPNVNGDILQKGWEVKEKTATVFAKAGLDTEVGGMQLRGNLGLQLINTDQNSTAPSIDNQNQGGFTLVTRGKKFNDVLPSLNLNLDLGSGQVLKLGAAQTLARARMDQLSAFQRTEFNNGKFTGSGGNPLLDPFRANALDLAYEKYFGNKGYVSAAFFYKQLKSYIFDFKDLNFDFKNLPDLKGVPGIPPNTFIGEYSQPRNGSGGKISGIELAASVPLNMLTDALDGFGVQLNFSNTSSAIKPFGDGDTRALPGLSKQVASLTAYFEKYGFSARVAQRYRSDFLAEIQGFGGNRDLGKYNKAESIVDLQLGYEFQDGFAKGLSFLLQLNNASNSKYQEYTDPATKQITKTDLYGKTYLFGATYKF